MSASLLSLPAASSRSIEWLVGPETLLSSTALSTSQLGSLGTIASSIEGAVDAAPAETGTSQLPNSIDPIANQFILDTHAQLENTGDQVAPLIGPVHGLTNLGETIGLGHLGQSGNLLTDLGSVAADPTNTDAIAPLLTDTGHIAGAADALVDAVAAVPVAGNGLVGPGSVLTPATDILNQAVLDVHTTLEDVGHEIPVLNAPIHGLTGLGETAGLGHVDQGSNLITDSTELPGSILNGGGLASADPILTDLGNVLGAADTLGGSLTGAANASGLLSSDGLLGPVTNLANIEVLDFHTTLEDIGHEIPVLNDSIHGLTNLGETIGLGHVGESGNLLTDSAALPGDLLDGQGVGALSSILNDAGSVTNATGGLLDGVAGIGSELGGSGAGTPVGGVLAPITSVVDSALGSHSASPVEGLLGEVAGGGSPTGGGLLGSGDPLQPVANGIGGLVDDVQAPLGQAGHDASVLSGALPSVTDLGTATGLGTPGASGNLLSDATALPGAVLSGNGSPALTQVASDVGHIGDGAGGVLGSVTGSLAGGTAGSSGAGAPVDSPVASVTTPAGTINAGGVTSLGNLANGTTAGDAGGGTHPLVDVAAGPATSAPVADAAVLTPAADPAHAVQVSAIAAPADQPSLANASLLTGDSITFPQNGNGADALVGQLHDVASAAAAAPAAADASHDLNIDVGSAVIDPGVNANVQHTDPTPHTATTGGHLLGL